MEEKKSLGKELQEKLTFTQPHIADEQPDAVAEAERFCVDYKAFLDAAKTEREAAAEVERRALAAGYRPMQRTGVTYKTGDKVFYNNRGKAMLLATLGKRPLDEGVRLMVAHIDSPRLDLKPNPLYEDSDIALFKTHYYGGIRKYQWGATPLSLHGVVYRKDGTKVEVRLGEEAGDPVFCVTDLLPHLGAEQNKRTLADGLRGEELNIVVGSLPYADKELKERVKLYTLTLLNEKYGITERDFTRAELEAVPAVKASDVGFDRSMIGAYGHDDRVCAYTALQAELGVKEPEYTTVCILADKEEVGSDGPTGLVSDFVFHFLGYLADAQGANYKLMLQTGPVLPLYRTGASHYRGVPAGRIWRIQSFFPRIQAGIRHDTQAIFSFGTKGCACVETQPHALPFVILHLSAEIQNLVTRSSPFHPSLKKHLTWSQL